MLALPAALPCRLLVVEHTGGLTRATVGPNCPPGEWVQVTNTATGSSARAVVEGLAATATAGATAPATVTTSPGVAR